MTKTSQTWWIWSAWTERQSQKKFVYGCLAECTRSAGWESRKSFPLSDGSQLVAAQRTVNNDESKTIRRNLAAGSICLSSIFAIDNGDWPIAERRQIIHGALGHSAAHIDAYCRFEQWQVMCSEISAWREILRTLKQELGLPFEKDYSAHIGNFEVMHLHSWLDWPQPFGIVSIEATHQSPPDRSVRAFQIFRSAEFAADSHLAHVVAYGCKERILDQILTLPAGQLRSEIINTPEVTEAYEFSLFDCSGRTLLHRESNSFVTSIGLVTSLAGQRIRVDDRLSKKASNSGTELGQRASDVTARSSQRSLVDCINTRPFRNHAASMRRLANNCFPEQSDDRWFPKSLDGEIGVIAHFNSLLSGGHVKSAILVDPYFGVDAFRFLLRLESTDVTLTIVTSWSHTDPDTGRFFSNRSEASEKLLSTLNKFQGLTNPNVRVVNLVAGNDQAFHDRYLLIYPHDGGAKVFLLSNSVNNMAGNWPFCMSRLADDVANEAQEYIEGLSHGDDITGRTSPDITFTWPIEA